MTGCDIMSCHVGYIAETLIPVSFGHVTTASPVTSRCTPLASGLANDISNKTFQGTLFIKISLLRIVLRAFEKNINYMQAVDLFFQIRDLAMIFLWMFV